MPWPKGRKFSEEHRQKISRAGRGRPKSDEHRQKIGEAQKGKPMLHLRGRRLPVQFIGRGSDNPAWRGDQASYGSIHTWMSRNYPKTGRCEKCGSLTRTEWANIDHAYRRVREEWCELCTRCHRRFDGVTGLAKDEVPQNRPFSGSTMRRSPDLAVHRDGQ